jgi:hypothetical protein
MTHTVDIISDVIVAQVVPQKMVARLGTTR